MKQLTTLQPLSHLIPITEFIERFGDNPREAYDSENDWLWSEHFSLEMIRGYRSFVQQPLQLGMFIPVSDEGEVLSEPVGECCGRCDGVHDECIADVRPKYNKAIKHILFEGFSYHIDKDGVWFVRNTFFKLYDFEFEHGYNVECLLLKGSPITLTQAANDKIFGK